MLPFAMPLLQLVARLRTSAVATDPAILRERTDAELRNFETRAIQAGFSADQVRRAQYALCESLDDVVLNTPWGAASAWAQHPTTATFHPTVGPGRFFDVLHQAETKVSEMRPVLELMALCLSAGMLGALRHQPDGAAQLDSIRAAAFGALLGSAPPAPTELAAEWKGADAPFRRAKTRLPVWVAASAAVAIAGGVYLFLSLRLNESGDALFARMLGAPPSGMPALSREPVPAPPPPPAAPEPTAQDRLRTRLAAAIGAGTVVIAGSPGVPVLRLPERAVFTPGGATLAKDAPALLQAVAAALKPEAGTLRVVGYTDDRPPRSALFPSAFKLSAARAEAVRAALAPDLNAGTPLAAEGRANAEPLVPNTTAENREQNRRVEIVLDGAK